MKPAPVRVPLESIPTERAVLGAILRDSRLYWENQGQFSPALFVAPLHAAIANAMVDLVTGGRDITVPAVLARLPVQEEQDISLEGYVATLVADQADVQNLADNLSDLDDMRVRRAGQALGAKMISVAAEQGSAIDAIQKVVEEARTLTVETGVEPGRQRRAILDRMLSQVADAYKGRGTAAKPWVIRAIRQVLSDEMEPGWLFGLMADSGGGKTSLALQQVRHAAELGQPQLFFSCDQTEEMCWLQMAAQKLGFQAGNYRRGQITEKEYVRLREAVQDFRALPIEIMKIGRPSIAQIVSHVRAFRRRHGPNFAWTLDHLKRVRMPPRAMLSEHVNEMCGEFKAVCLDTESAGLMLMQRNSESGKRDDPRPIRRDIYGGEGVVENFDAVMALYIEETWLRQELRKVIQEKRRDQLAARLSKVQGKAEIIALKVRFGRPDESAMVKRDAEFTRFVDIEAPREYAEPSLDFEREYG